MLSKKASILLNRLLAKKGLKKKAASDFMSIASSHILLGAFGTDIKFKVEGKNGEIIEKDISQLKESDVVLVTAQKPDGTITHIPKEEAEEQGFTILGEEVRSQRIDTEEKIRVYKGPSFEVYTQNAAKAIKEIFSIDVSTPEGISQKEDKVEKFYRLYGDRRKFNLKDYLSKFEKIEDAQPLVTVKNLHSIYDSKFSHTLSNIYTVSKEKYEENKDFYVPVYEPLLDENSVIQLDANGRYVPKEGAKIQTEKANKRGTTSFKAIQKQAEKFKGKDLEFVIAYFAGMSGTTKENVKTYVNRTPEIPIVPKPLVQKVKSKELTVIDTTLNQFKNFSENLLSDKVKEIFEEKKDSSKSYEGVLFSLEEMKIIAEDSSSSLQHIKKVLEDRGVEVSSRISDITKLKTWANSEFTISMNNIKNEANHRVQAQKNEYNAKYFELYGLEMIRDSIYINFNSKNLIETDAIKKYKLKLHGNRKDAIKKIKEELATKSPLTAKEFIDPVLELDKDGFELSLSDIRENVDTIYALNFLGTYKKYDSIYFFEKGVEKKLKDVKSPKIADLYTTLVNYQKVHLDFKSIMDIELEKIKQEYLQSVAFRKSEIEEIVKKEYKNNKKKLTREKLKEEVLSRYETDTTIYGNITPKKKLLKERNEKINLAELDILGDLEKQYGQMYKRSLVYFNPREALIFLDKQRKEEIESSLLQNRVSISEVYGGTDIEAYKKYRDEASQVKDVEMTIPWFLQSGNKKADTLGIVDAFNDANKIFKIKETIIGNLPAYGIKSPINSAKQANLDKLLLLKKEIESENLRKQVSGYTQQSTKALDDIKNKIAKLKAEIKTLNEKPIDFITDSYSFPRTNTGSESSVSPWGSVGYQYSADLHKAKQAFQERKKDKELQDFAKLVAKCVVIGLNNLEKQARMFNAFIMKGGAKEEVRYEEFFDNILEVQSNSNNAVKAGLKANIETALDNFSLKSGAYTIYPLKDLGKASQEYIDLKNTFNKVLSGEITKEQFIVSVESVLDTMKPSITKKYKGVKETDITSTSLITGVCSSRAVNPKDVAERASTTFVKMVSSRTQAVSEDGELDLTDLEAYGEYQTNRMNSENSRRDLKKCVSSLSEDNNLALELLELFGDDSYIFSKSLASDASELSEITSVVYVKGEEYSAFAEKGSIDYEELENFVYALFEDLGTILSNPMLEVLKKYLGVYGKVDINDFDKETVKELNNLKNELDSIFSKHGIEKPDYFKLLSAKGSTQVIPYLLDEVKNVLYPQGLEEPAMEMNVNIKKSSMQDIIAFNIIKFGLKQDYISFNESLNSSDLQEIYYSIFKKTYDLELNKFKKAKDKDAYIASLIKGTTLVAKTEGSFEDLILFLKSKLCLPVSKSGKKLSSWTLTKAQKTEIENDESIIDAFKEIANSVEFLNTDADITVGDFDEKLLDKIGFSYFNRMFERNFSGSNQVFEFKIAGLIKEKSQSIAVEKTLAMINTNLGTTFKADELFVKEDGHYKFNIHTDVPKLVLSLSLKMYASMLLLDLANGRKDILTEIFEQESSWWKLFSFSGKATTSKLSTLVNLYKSDLKQLGKFMDNHEALEQHFKSSFKSAPTKFNTTPEEAEETKEEKKSAINNLVAREIASFFDRVNISNDSLEISADTNKVDYIYETLNKLTNDGLDKVIKNSMAIQETVSELEIGSLIVDGEVTAKGFKTVEKLSKIKGALSSELQFQIEQLEGGTRARKIVTDRNKYMQELNGKAIMLNDVKTDLRNWSWSEFSKSTVEPLTFAEIFGLTDTNSIINYLIKNPNLRESFLDDAISVLRNEVATIKAEMKEAIDADKELLYKEILESVYGSKNNSVLSIIGNHLLGYVNDHSIKQKTTKKVIQMILNSFINKA